MPAPRGTTGTPCSCASRRVVADRRRRPADARPRAGARSARRRSGPADAATTSAESVETPGTRRCSSASRVTEPPAGRRSGRSAPSSQPLEEEHDRRGDGAVADVVEHVVPPALDADHAGVRRAAVRLLDASRGPSPGRREPCSTRVGSRSGTTGSASSRGQLAAEVAALEAAGPRLSTRRWAGQAVRASSSSSQSAPYRRRRREPRPASTTASTASSSPASTAAQRWRRRPTPTSTRGAGESSAGQRGHDLLAGARRDRRGRPRRRARGRRRRRVRRPNRW